MGQEHETYYVPDQSKLPLFASLGLFLTVMGLGNWLMEISAGKPGSGPTVFVAGLLIFGVVLWTWFGQVIKENAAGMNSAQLKRSYVWGMGWFIFSEVMFFAAFFGALFYMRQLALPWLSEGPTNEFLWNGFSAEWPLMITPDMAVNGEAANVTGPAINMSGSEVTWSNFTSWLPLWNTLLLITSSVTVHFAHTALKKGNNGRAFNIWLAITVSLGALFLVLQAEEYIHAYHEGLTLDSGAYGTTFFMLTGFHGLHVTLGSIMLLVQLNRSVESWKWRLVMLAALFGSFAVAFAGHMSLGMRLGVVAIACAALIVISSIKPNNVFTHHDCFGFEASSWYWHFVDVVWVGLFIFVYILG